jgi:iron complex outermembrane receptor protein
MNQIYRRAMSSTALALALGVGAPALAQEAETAKDIIVTAQQAQKQVISNADLGALGSKSALETPFNVTNYTAQLVLDQQSETIGDVLKNDPSVRTTYGSGNQSELFVIRGFALNGDDVAIDGLYGVTPRQIVSPELYENIQVLNGANAFLFGAAPGGSGIGGGINLIPKRATKTLLRATASYGAKSVFGGNFDAGTRFGADDAFGIRVNGVYRNGETSIDNERRGVRVIGASFDYHKGPGRFFLDFGYEDQRAYQPRPELRLATTALAIPNVPRASANYAQPWSYTKLRDIYTLARAEVDITPNVMAYIAAGFRDGREDGDYSTLTITNSATGAATQSRLFVPREDNNESGKLGLRGKFTVAGISNEWNVGGSANYTENRNAFAFGAFPTSVRNCGATATAFCTNLYAPVSVAKPANGTTGGNLGDVPRVSKSAFTSLFASDTLGFIDNRVLVTVGARRQGMIVEGFDRATFLRTTRYAQTVTTPVVGLILRPTQNLSLYANRIEGLAQGPTAPTNATITNPGAIFPPFRSKQYEVGAKYAVKGLTATLALYQTKQPNGYSKTTPTTANPLATTYVIEGQQRNRGIELSLNGEPTDYLRFIGGVTITDARLTNTLGGATDGNRAIGVPDYQVNFGAEVVPWFLKDATLTGRVVRTGTQYLDVTNLQKLSGWTRFDLGMRYVVVAARHPITLRLSAENIANRRYWSSAFGGYLLQGLPRTIKSSVTFEY